MKSYYIFKYSNVKASTERGSTAGYYWTYKATGLQQWWEERKRRDEKRSMDVECQECLAVALRKSILEKKNNALI